ncbi:hypothetical protein E4T56_gene8110 [Termitomyces sp. T112]|nr:hypothetical protein E4T56_gene8110 [Termitomyces sp. T112]
MVVCRVGEYQGIEEEDWRQAMYALSAVTTPRSIGIAAITPRICTQLIFVGNSKLPKTPLQILSTIASIHNFLSPEALANLSVTPCDC